MHIQSYTEYRISNVLFTISSQYPAYLISKHMLLLLLMGTFTSTLFVWQIYAPCIFSKLLRASAEIYIYSYTVQNTVQNETPRRKDISKECLERNYGKVNTLLNYLLEQSQSSSSDQIFIESSGLLYNYYTKFIETNMKFAILK